MVVPTKSTSNVRRPKNDMDHLTDTVLMVRPVAFGFNTQTAKSNVFQGKAAGLSVEQIRVQCDQEFDGFVAQLRASHINVEVFDDTPTPVKPDAIFPNNWMTTHTTTDGRKLLLTYPMLAPNRRLERRPDIIQTLVTRGYTHNSILERHESVGRFLEGTGSVVFDHASKRAYAALSPRTDQEILSELCSLIDYTPEVFHAFDQSHTPIYHTNVLLTIGEGFAVLGTDTITDPVERRRVLARLREGGHEVIHLTHEQISRFAGNMLQVRSTTGVKCLIMSVTAHNSLTKDQIERLESRGSTIIPVSIPLIERIGGGSARCMLAEMF